MKFPLVDLCSSYALFDSRCPPPYFLPWISAEYKCGKWDLIVWEWTDTRIQCPGWSVYDRYSLYIKREYVAGKSQRFFWAIFQDMAAMFASVGMSEQAVEAYTKVRAMCAVRLDLNGYWCWNFAVPKRKKKKWTAESIEISAITSSYRSIEEYAKWKFILKEWPVVMVMVTNFKLHKAQKMSN